MNPGRPSPRLATAVFEQCGRHVGTGKRASEAAPPAGRSLHQNASVVELELDLRAGVEATALSEVLRDHDLPFGADPMSHTEQV
jgi:hypothetical protein